ncbi:MAG: phenylphosphate synthase subunit beta [Deltaproteobacteria bacterium]|jgi:pyruvate,water dikinase|nr:phenylphosphate synthase subunit beta [Deltaproteobacteria bacterium]
MDLILDFRKLNKSSLPLVGGKNASLGEMINAGIRVPPGFAVTTDSYAVFMEKAGINDTIFSLLADLDPDNIDALNQTAEKVQEMIRTAVIPDDVQKMIGDGYSLLCEKCEVDALPVAVRSSATAEDLPTASFAGQQDTYLWITGAERIIESVRKCWASLYTARAISYRVKNDFPHEKVLISVGVQKMVNSRAAGVMFTINPTDGDISKVVIEGSWGLGETVVSGSVNPDKFVVDKVMGEINERTISTKHIECVFDVEKGETVDADIAEDLQCTCCLEDQEIKELVKTGKTIEAHYGRAMDIEWAIDKDFAFPENIFIVQARPETVWSQRKKESVLGKKTGLQLLMEQAMKRIKLPG